MSAVTGFEGTVIESIPLEAFLFDPDDEDGMEYEIVVMSEEGVADLYIEGDSLRGSLVSPGQSNLSIRGTSGGLAVTTRTVVGTWPELTGDLLLSDFGDLSLDPDTYWNGSDGSGSFISNNARFYNSYNQDYGSWSGWSYSNTSDMSTPGYLNQFSAITGSGFGPGEGNGIYAVSNLYGSSVIDFPGGSFTPEGFFVTNSTYATLSMEEGDAFSKAFGGPDGSDPDYFKLLVWGRKNGITTDTVEYYLADYRFESGDKDFITRTWQWVDLGMFGKVDSLLFGLASSDMGDWGMNTPAYFCLDNLYLRADQAPVVAHPLGDIQFTSSSADTTLSLAGVFTDPDDPDSSIVTSIAHNSNEDLLLLDLNGELLTVFVPSQATEDETFEVVIAGMSGAFSVTDTFAVHYQHPLGIRSQHKGNFQLYPNPSHDWFKIQGIGDVTDLRIYDLTGNLIMELPPHDRGQSVDVAALPAGAYFVVGSDRDHRFTQKLIKD
jgi:hypothetical protein